MTPGNKIGVFVGSRNVSVTAIPVIGELKRNGRNEVLVIRFDSPMANFVQKALDGKVFLIRHTRHIQMLG